jgi:NAD(P)H-dependent FMN reductase
LHYTISKKKMMDYSIPIIIGTSRKNNESQKVARFLFNKLQSFPQIDTCLLDLEKANFPIMEERLGVMENPPKLLEEWNELLSKANAIIIVAPEYKNGYPGALKNLLDFLPAGVFKYKPMAISTVTSGEHGGTNCLAQLRLVCLSMGGVPIPDRFQVSKVSAAFDETGKLKNKKINATADKFLGELLKYTKAFSSF